ncbi:xanthine dehydrogenase family protein subunit M [Roseiarcaceae bacterium H3SJ34-1]|uniref:FAD binding domain-containing protein n=1 Tax=Terripilifer ovatus TaxID=3032367 RepID=UPI003AB95368|nr:xanthine dehydrogenase family protein subunit M [Roseiarcaceae bacterium H3SJ34-1]
MYAFNYNRAETARKAVNLAGKLEDAKFLAGGQTLLPTMKQRLASPGGLIDLSAAADLKGIEMKGRNLVIGAMTRHVDVATSELVKEKIPALADLAGMIGDPAVRNRGTIGGSVANDDPAADYPAACLALNATIITNKRKIPADEFFTGLFETALEDGELIVKISFPLPNKAAYEKFRNPASRYAIVGVFVAKKGKDVRVAVTGAGANGVFRASNFEAALTAKFHVKALEGISAKAEGLNSDIHADAAYRAHLIGVMARRAVAKANAK